tara:strand:- start:10021 stop:10950 length:930 start_codon:yes stop_codon:yes gene_type:complete
MFEVPSHISWSINGKVNSTFKHFLDNQIPLKTFDYNVYIDNNIKADTFRKECIKAAELLPNNLAIPVSGGDSEIVARSVHALGKQATIYYEDYPWVSSTYKDMSKKVAEELNYEWIDYTADYDQCIERMKKYSVMLGNMSRGFLITLGLFEKIPHEQFIVGGLGELEKDGWIYRKTMENCIGPDWDKELTIPCPPTEIIWWLWAKEQKRAGQYTFFNSTKSLIKSQVEHKKLSYGKHNKGVCNTIAMKNYEWPELIYKNKTDHFHPTDDFYNQIYKEMENNMYEHYDRKMFKLVKNGFCGFVNYTKLLS